MGFAIRRPDDIVEVSRWIHPECFGGDVSFPVLSALNENRTILANEEAEGELRGDVGIVKEEETVDYDELRVLRSGGFGEACVPQGDSKTQ